jgi:hypothetical protein
MVTLCPDAEMFALFTDGNISRITDVIVAVHDLIMITIRWVVLSMSAPMTSMCSGLLVVSEDQVSRTATSVATDSLAVTISTFCPSVFRRLETGTSDVSFGWIEIDLSENFVVSPLWTRSPPLSIYSKE